MNDLAFSRGGNTVAISATTTSASQSVDLGTGDTLLITNVGLVVSFVTTGIDTATATATSVPLLPNGQILITRRATHNVVAAITASSTATVYATPGWGKV